MIGFAGLSHLGLVSGVATAAKGFEVLGYDPDAALVEALEAGRLPVFEPDLPELLEANRPRIRLTADPSALAACDVVFVSLDVTTSDDGVSDLSALTRLVDEVLRSASPVATVVVLSQVPPGFTSRLAAGLDRSRGLQLYYQVETLIFGRAVERALHPERFIVGCADPKAHFPAPYAELLASFGCPVLPMRYESAELCKISINVCLVASISVANTLAEICESIGADWSEIAPALKLDKRIGPHAYLTPGLGIGGGNLGRDLATVIALAGEHGTDAGVVSAWIANSRHRRDWALKALHSNVVARHENPVVAVWGLAYKADTKFTMNSPALALVGALGGIPMRAYDPQVVLGDDTPPNVVQCSSAIEACAGADALAIMTPWGEFSSVDPSRVRDVLRGDVVVDPYGVLDGDRCASLGLKHFRLGAGARQQERAE